MSRQAANGASYEVFETTMARLEQALSVGQIATFGFTWCDAAADPRRVLDGYPDFDQIPVRQDGKVVGVLERREGALEATVAESMRPLDVSMLVAAEQPLTEFIPALEDGLPYRLVLRGQELDGIVTRSDLLKLPVRLLAFARVTHLELILANMISAYFDEDSWLDSLCSKRRKSLKRWHADLQEKREDPPILELTRFPDKAAIVAKLPGVESCFGDDMDEIVELRHKLAHSGDFLAEEQALEQFLKRLRLADDWIAKLSEMLNASA